MIVGPVDASPDRRTIERALCRRFLPEADAAAVAAGVTCGVCGAAADVELADGQLRCVTHRFPNPAGAPPS